jgi:hypothetical protein
MARAPTAPSRVLVTVALFPRSLVARVVSAQTAVPGWRFRCCRDASVRNRTPTAGHSSSGPIPRNQGMINLSVGAGQAQASSAQP